MKNRIHILIIAAISLLTCSCATDTPNESANTRGRITNQMLAALADAVGGSAASAFVNVAIDARNQDKADMGNAASLGLWSTMGKKITANLAGQIINAWGGGQLAPVAATAEAKVKEIEKTIGPLTTSESGAVLNTIAGAISKKANL